MGINAMDDPASIKFQDDAASPDPFKFMSPTISGIRSGFDSVNTMGIR